MLLWRTAAGSILRIFSFLFLIQGTASEYSQKTHFNRRLFYRADYPVLESGL